MSESTIIRIEADDPILDGSHGSVVARGAIAAYNGEPRETHYPQKGGWRQDFMRGYDGVLEGTISVSKGPACNHCGDHMATIETDEDENLCLHCAEEQAVEAWERAESTRAPHLDRS